LQDSIVLLFAWFGCTNLGRMTDLACDPQLVQQFQKPVHRSGGCDPHQNLAGECRIKLPHFITIVLKGLLDQLACLGIQHRDGLLSRVQINAYNLQLGSSGSSAVRVNTETVSSGRSEAGVVMTSVSTPDYHSEKLKFDRGNKSLRVADARRD
jgi:hypothetical protein